MSINAIQNTPKAVSFGEEPQKKSGSAAVPGAVTGAIAGGAIGYLALKTPMNMDKLGGLKEDDFNKSVKAPDDKTSAVKDFKTKFNEIKESDAKADKELKEKFPDAKETITTEDYLKYIGQKDADSLNKAIANAEGKTEGLKTALTEAKDDAKKAKTAQAKLDKNTAEIAKLKGQKTILEGATEVKEGEKVVSKTISLKTLKENISGKYKAEAEKEAKTAYEAIKEFVKKEHSTKFALIGAGIGAVALGILGHFMGGSKPEAAPAPEAPKA